MFIYSICLDHLLIYISMYIHMYSEIKTNSIKNIFNLNNKDQMYLFLKLNKTISAIQNKMYKNSLKLRK